MSLEPTRGERNNNPGNIREYKNDGTHWRGERATNDDLEFEEFLSPADGIRALARILINYQRKHGLKTIRQIIERWAPGNENNTDSYINHVAQRVGVDADVAIDLGEKTTLAKLAKAIIVHENGRCIYADNIIDASCHAAIP